MEIRPADLGDAYQTALVLRRAHVKNGTASTNRITRALTRRAVRGLKLPEAVEAETLPAARRYIWPSRFAALAMAVVGAAQWGSPEGLAAHLIGTGALAGGCYLALEALPRFAVHSLYHKPLTENEVRRLQAPSTATILTASTKKPVSKTHSLLYSMVATLVGRDDLNRCVESAATLESDYFDLILAALKTPTPESSLELELRATLRQIGTAVANVRRSEIAEDSADAADLIGDAEMLAARARTEGDRVVAASLLRQAQAKVAQAKIVERNVVLRRRTRALGAELRAQIAAAQSSLRNISSQGMMNAESGGAFRVISESVRTLAVEADSVAQAHDELAVALREAVPRQSTAGVRTTDATASLPTRVPAVGSEETVLSNRRGGG